MLGVYLCLQGRLTGRLAGLYEEGKGLRDTLRLALVAVGRGGQGDVGQRIRDEILTVQSNNGAKVSCFVSFACSDIHRGKGSTFCNLTRQLDCIYGADCAMEGPWA